MANSAARATEASGLGFGHATALLDVGRPDRALAAATRGLERRPACPDVESRLRLQRAVALWLSGGPSARSELEKARRLARERETHAGVACAAALFRWRDMRLGEAWRALEATDPPGLREVDPARAWLESCLLRDEGRFAAALARIDGGLRAAVAGGPAGWEGRLRTDKAALLASLGRWAEARQQAVAARQSYEQAGDPRALTVAGAALAAIDLATGDLAAARGGLERAWGLLQGDRSNPRPRGDALLLWSDLHLAGGSTAEAIEAASQAVSLFDVARDRRGRGFAHVRQVHALVAGGRFSEALLEARRALRCAAEGAGQPQAWAQLALGRVLLRLDRRAAARHFGKARQWAGERRDLGLLARLGEALSAGESAALRDLVSDLEAWGDRRVLALAMADLRDLVGGEPADAGSAEPAAVAPPGHAERMLVDAALALARPGDVPTRWAAAMHAARTAVPWRQATLLAPAGLELRLDLGQPRPCRPEGPFAPLAGRLASPRVLDAGDRSWQAHPERALHGWESAVAIPIRDGRALCLAFAEPGAASRHLALASELARLLEGVEPEPAPEPPAPQDGAKFPEILGRCEPMRALFAEMARVAGSEVFVHVAGETGTGKGRVALALHERSRRRGGRFVAINASSISDELFEAELFGHARGAFTGAVAAREGHVAEAEGGTLFIDEVADLSPRAQAKLLRLLQEREYRRVGESQLRRADVRVISASNAELEERVARGLFREDLMYRLAVVTLRLPPLRDRGDDLLLLARHFLRAAAGRDGRPAPELPQPLAGALRRHAWPGNVRELENEMSRLVALAAGGPLDAARLSPRVGSGAAPRGPRLREALAGFERDFLREALVRSAGNRSRAAATVGISRQALLNKMSRLGLT